MWANDQNQHGPGVLSKEEIDAQEHAFQERVEADIKIGAKDWMPGAYRKTR